jgi:hypothetical protein
MKYHFISTYYVIILIILLHKYTFMKTFMVNLLHANFLDKFSNAKVNHKTIDLPVKIVLLT